MIEYNYDEASNRLHVTVTDVLTSTEIAGYFASVPSIPGLRPGFVEVVDLTLVTDLEIRLSEMKRLQALSMAMIAAGHEVTHVLAFTPLSQAMMPLMTPLFHHVELNIHVFRDAFEYACVQQSLLEGQPA